jgi:phage shock protein A
MHEHRRYRDVPVGEEMSGEPDQSVLDFLRAQFDRVHVSIAKLDLKVAELAQRMTTLEIQVGGLIASEQSHYALTMQRMDGVEARLDRIERRLDLVDARP